jgi:hypothetical protein
MLGRSVRPGKQKNEKMGSNRMKKWGRTAKKWRKNGVEPEKWGRTEIYYAERKNEKKNGVEPRFIKLAIGVERLFT